MPFLEPFAFFCPLNWDAASKILIIPAGTPVLLLSGIQDEIVPRDHMWQELCELVHKRVPRSQRDLHAEQGDGRWDERREYQEPRPDTGVAKF